MLLRFVAPVVILAAALGSFAGCAAVERQLLQSPTAGGAPWIELDSEHFSVRTDYPEWTARAALDIFDTSTRALISLALPAGSHPPPNRLSVALFAHGDDLRELLGDEHVAGMFRAPGDGSHPILLVSTDGSFVTEYGQTRTTIQHELSHWLFNNAVPGMPVWLDEGLARYWESLRLEDGQALIGSLPQLDLLVDWPNAADVMNTDYRTFHARGGYRYYSAAWGMVYILYTKHGDAFAHYLAALASGARGEAAWRSAFGTFDGHALDAEMRDWFSADRPWAHAAPMPLRARDFGPAKPVSPAEVLLLWAQLRPTRDPKMLARSIDELTTAERLEPDSTVVQGMLVIFEFKRGKRDEAVARLDRALSKHGDDVFLLRLKSEVMLQAELARPPGDRDFTNLEAMTAKLADARASAVSLQFAARVAAFAGDSPRAIQLAERATKREPDCEPCFDTLSLARAQEGDVEGAVRAAETALRLLPDGVSDRKLADRLSELNQSLRHK
jgi:tetratricopeptide (TPR) repeat protein